MVKKNLSMSKVKKISKQIDEKEQHIIEYGRYKGEQITYQPIFNTIMIEELLIEFGNLMQEAEDGNVILPEDTQIYLVQMLIIKYFTHFKNDIPNILIGEGNSAGLLDALEHFRKTELYDECFNNMFSTEEVNKVFSKLTDFSAKGLLALDINEKVQQKFSNLKIKNKNIFEQIDGIKM